MPADQSYYYDVTQFDESTFASFSFCHFVSDGSPTATRALWFNAYNGSISITSCSFSGITSTEELGGAVSIISMVGSATEKVSITSTNFSDCSCLQNGGGLFVVSHSPVTVTHCRCVGCEAKGSLGPQQNGGGISIHIQKCSSAIGVSVYGNGGGMVLTISKDISITIRNLRIEDCCSEGMGGGLNVQCPNGSASLSDCQFIRCRLNGTKGIYGQGGGVNVLSVEKKCSFSNCVFEDCSSNAVGGALLCSGMSLEMIDCVVRNCFADSFGAVCSVPNDPDSSMILSNVLLIGNTVGATPVFPPTDPSSETTQFVDIAIYDASDTKMTTITVKDCITTTAENSAGFYSELFEADLEAFANIGPRLTELVSITLDAAANEIRVTLTGMIPIPSQKYDLTIREGIAGEKTTQRIQFTDGKCVLTSLSTTKSLKFDTEYTITSIVGIVPASTYSLSNDIEIPVAAWVFNLAGNPSFATFTTPPQPPTLIGATAHLVSDESNSAHVIIVFNEKVKGSFVFVVEEGGKDVEISVHIPDPSLIGESENFVVAGTNKVLAHDANYTIKSISPKPETEPEADSTPFVWMSDTIKFHVPKIPGVPTEEPEEPKPTPEDPKKSQLTPEMKMLLSWLIPLVVCLFVALLISIVIIFVVNRRKHKTPANQNEMEEQVQVDVEEKMDVLPDGVHTTGFLQAAGLTHSAFQSTGDDVPEGTRSVDSKPSLTEAEFAEVMMCSGDYPVTVARVHETLYSVLHKEHREFGKRTVGIKIVNGLKQVVANRGWSDVLTRLSSHWVLLDAEGNVQLKLQMNASEAEQEALHTQQKNQNGEMNSASQGQQEKKSKVGMDGLRWRAPEVVDGRQVDGHKAAVFSLGLVLWEMETGEVPFGEVDAVNAQRQSGTGVGPKMSEMKNEELKSVILRCVSVNPKERPTLTEVGDFLNSQPEDPNLASRNDMGEANS